MEKKQTAVEWLDELFLKYTNWIEGDPTATEYTLTELFNDFEKAKEMERQQLEAAFKAGWMRANATNYDDSYFQHFISETYDNH